MDERTRFTYQKMRELYTEDKLVILFDIDGTIFKGWGMSRFSIKWSTPHLQKVLDFIDRMGLEANIYDVPDLETFLKTVLLMPRSITSDFNFPEWHYFGRGSGQKNQHYEYSITRFPQTA